MHIKTEGAMVTLLEEIEPQLYQDFIYIDINEKMHVCRIQEGYTWHHRSIITLLDKTLQNPIRDGLPEKRI